MSAAMPAKSESLYLRLPNFAIIGGSDYLPTILGKSTKSDLPHIIWQQNTGESASLVVEGGYTDSVSFNNNRQYIRLEESFEKQLKEFEDVLHGQNDYSLHEKMLLSTETILSCLPDAVSMELTHEGSIFYTFLKNKFTVYFQHFLVDEYDDSDEVIFSIFNGEENVINFAGSFNDSETELNKVLFPESSLIREIA